VEDKASPRVICTVRSNRAVGVRGDIMKILIVDLGIDGQYRRRRHMKDVVTSS
jgi:hypothetical protein